MQLRCLRCGAFELLGYPLGFDFHATDNGTVHEMGSTAPSQSELVVVRPTVRELDEQPPMTLRILRATADGWQLVAESSDASLRITPQQAGAYRAEVRMQPRHLLPVLSAYASLAEREFVWIYSNAIWME